LVLGLILSIGSAEAGKRTDFRKGQVYEGEISWLQKINISISKNFCITHLIK